MRDRYNFTIYILFCLLYYKQKAKFSKCGYQVCLPWVNKWQRHGSMLWPVFVQEFLICSFLDRRWPATSWWPSRLLSQRSQRVLPAEWESNDQWKNVTDIFIKRLDGRCATWAAMAMGWAKWINTVCTVIDLMVHRFQGARLAPQPYDKGLVETFAWRRNAERCQA